MARSDRPIEATPQPARRREPTFAEGSSAGGEEPAGGSLARRNLNWFEPGFDAGEAPTAAVRHPAEPLSDHAVSAADEHSVVEPAPPQSEAGAPGEGPGGTVPEVPPDTAAPSDRSINPSLETSTEAPPEPVPPHPRQAVIGDLVVRAGKVAAIVISAWFCVVLVLIVLYRFVNPPFSALMAAQWLGGTTIRQDWVPIESISPNLIHAVVVSEDGRFCEHWGVDFVEIAQALRRTPHGPPRGASTITMQVAKNLFLWPAKSYLRKVIEVPLTYAIELFWPKRRILEVYLNIAEWGPGIFGAEAASQAHFNRSASRLSPRQAAQLAVVLPNPIVRDAGDPGPRTSHRASVIQRRTGREPEAIACVLGGE